MIIAKKGYTVEVVSWENDGDNYRTKSHTYESKDLAVAVAKMCTTLFKSKNNSKFKGIGNSDDERDAPKSKEKIIEYMKKNPILTKDMKVEDDDHLVDICMDYNYNLMGNSEYYYSRVCESAKIFYVGKDIEADEIDF